MVRHSDGKFEFYSPHGALTGLLVAAYLFSCAYAAPPMCNPSQFNGDIHLT